MRELYSCSCKDGAHQAALKALAALAAALAVALPQAFAADGARVFELVIAGGKVKGGDTLRVQRGERHERALLYLEVHP